MDVVQPPSRSALGAPRAPARGAWLLAGVLLLLVAGCRREEVTSYRVAKEIPPAAEAAGGDGLGASHRTAPAPTPPPGMAGDVPMPPTPSGAEAVKWTLPAGWGQSFPGGMRFATFKVPGAGKIDGSVVTLPGDAGGELPNVNRWRGQIGLGPTDAAGLAAARTSVTSRVGAVNVYDFTSEGGKKSRLIAAILMVDGSAWFIKLTGDAEPVTAARPAFLQLLGSLRRD
jgi:hypothetical protein